MLSGGVDVLVRRCTRNSEQKAARFAPTVKRGRTGCGQEKPHHRHIEDFTGDGDRKDAYRLLGIFPSGEWVPQRLHLKRQSVVSPLKYFKKNLRGRPTMDVITLRAGGWTNYIDSRWGNSPSALKRRHSCVTGDAINRQSCCTLMFRDCLLRYGSEHTVYF